MVKAEISGGMKTDKNIDSEKRGEFTAALYMRLSREDGDRRESESISGQRDLLHQFANHQEDLFVYSEYIDM